MTRRARAVEASALDVSEFARRFSIDDEDAARLVEAEHVTASELAKGGDEGTLPDDEALRRAEQRLRFLSQDLAMDTSDAVEAVISRTKRNEWAWSCHPVSPAPAAPLSEPPSPPAASQPSAPAPRPQEELRAKMRIWTAADVPRGEVDPHELARRHPRCVFRRGGARTTQTRAENLGFLAGEVGVRGFTCLMSCSDGLLSMGTGSLRARYEELLRFLTGIGMAPDAARRAVARQPQLMGASVGRKLVPSFVLLWRIGVPLKEVHNNLEVLMLALGGDNVRSKMLLLGGFGIPREGWLPVMLKASASKRLAPRLWVLYELGMDPVELPKSQLRQLMIMSDTQFEKRTLCRSGHRAGMYPLLVRHFVEIVPDMVRDLEADTKLAGMIPDVPGVDEAQRELERIRRDVAAMAAGGGAGTRRGGAAGEGEAE